jgi:hypothetical protein
LYQREGIGKEREENEENLKREKEKNKVRSKVKAMESRGKLGGREKGWKRVVWLVEREKMFLSLNNLLFTVL